MGKSAVLSDASENNFSAYRTQAHAKKATLRTVGSDLFDMALSLEEAGRELDSEEVIVCCDEILKGDD